MSTSKIVTFRNAFATALAAQLTSDGTSGVTVRKYPVAEPDREDMVTLGNASASQEHLALGGSRWERFTLDGDIMTPASGGSTDEASEAETRALVVLASVENVLRSDPTFTSAVFHAQIASYSSEALVDTQGYIGHVTFTVEVEAAI